MNRITNSMMTNRYLNNMQRNLKNMSTIQNQLATGKEISRASQNPFVATRNKQLNNEIFENTQYNQNIRDTSNWLDTTDTALAQAGNVMARIKELMIKAGDGAYSEDEIGTIKSEIVEKSKEFAQILNTTFEGEYIFGGTKSNTKPVTVDANGTITYADKDGNPIYTGGNSITLNNGLVPLTTDGRIDSTPVTSNTDPKKYAYDQISKHLKTEISAGVVVEYNRNACDILEFTDSSLPQGSQNVNVMDEMAKLVDSLTKLSDTDTTNDADAEAYMSGEGLTRMDSIIKNILTNRSAVGTMENRMKSALETNEDQSYNMTEILSGTEDIDFTQKTMEYAVMQTVYTASLQTSSKVLMNTIMDYI